MSYLTFINKSKMFNWVSLIGIALWFTLGTISTTEAETAVDPQLETFGYGFNVAEWDTTRLQNMGFNWMKVFDPPSSQMPVNVLLRLDANASHLGNINAWANNIESIAINNGAYIDAYEIGNEVNLDATYGWGYGSTNVPPVADDYVTLLCSVYSKIKAADPTATVVSAGLAPTGRVSGSWNGHLGHNGLFQDEREYFKEFISAGGGNCTDAIGYHPYGYSADFDTPPDTNGGTPDTNCTNGFCFRGVEKLYQLMEINGMGEKEVWATEYGWITQPPDNCLNDPGWSGRAWQIVSEQEQADNLVGSFQYATANYPWMGAMFVFNLNFNTAPWISDQCEQMRFYGVEGRPAEAALSNMPKVVTEPVGELSVTPSSWVNGVENGSLPFAETAVFQLTNSGTATLNYNISVDSGNDLNLTLQSPASGSLMPGESVNVEIDITLGNQPVGTYSGGITINATGDDLDQNENIEFRLLVWEDLFNHYLPIIQSE